MFICGRKGKKKNEFFFRSCSFIYFALRLQCSLIMGCTIPTTCNTLCSSSSMQQLIVRLCVFCFFFLLFFYCQGILDFFWFLVYLPHHVLFKWSLIVILNVDIFSLRSLVSLNLMIMGNLSGTFHRNISEINWNKISLQKYENYFIQVKYLDVTFFQRFPQQFKYLRQKLSKALSSNKFI